MKIAVIGTGHVGLITCVTLAALGHDVVGHDADEEKLISLARGVAPFYEPGLEELLTRSLATGRLRFSDDVATVLGEAQVAFICVGTPPRSSGEANLIAVERAASQVSRYASDGVAVVEKSTVPAGTAERVKRTLRLELGGNGPAFEVVSNPEFLREGRAIEDSMRPDRILIGADSPRAFSTMREVYAPLIERGHLLIETDIATAELAKHACNAFLALKISYANALARLCEQSGADVVAVADIMGSDPRIGRAFLNAGLGYGGYCFPKDLAAFERLAARSGYSFPLLREVERINGEAVEATLEKIQDALWNLEGKSIGLLGLSFKPDTDDVRFSPALTLARKLVGEGADVTGYDPQASSAAKSEVPELHVCTDAYEVAAGAHCLVICTDWDEFMDLDLGRLRDVMRYPVVVDARNLFEPTAMRRLGFAYYPTGRPAVPLGLEVLT